MWSLVILCLMVGTTCFAINVYEVMESNPLMSEFFKLVKEDRYLQDLCRSKTITIFVPLNSVMNDAPDWIWEYEKQLPMYHIAQSEIRKKNFPLSQQPDAAGAPPLRLIIHESEETGEREYFVNNAKIITQNEYNTSKGEAQILYIIDRVLDPYIPANALPPTALSFLNQPSVYNFKETFGVFTSRVRSENEDLLFQSITQHTYFLPRSISTGDTRIIEKLDRWVIRGHVVPNAILFTRIMGSKVYPTEAYSRVKVEISLANRTDETTGGYSLYIQSNTIHSDSHHKRGVLASKIIRPNIPVSNGVIHIIDVPLMIIDKSTVDFIKSKENGSISKFAELIKHQTEFYHNLASTAEKTVFIPNDKAFNSIQPEKLRQIMENKTEFLSLLKLHLVMKALTTEDVRIGNITSAKTSDLQGDLYFRTVGEKNRSLTLTVEGGGVNATVVEADYGVTDGIIHVIDRVLGMPFMTVFEKLKSDPDLMETFNISHLDEWNRQLSDRTKQFTFFAPGVQAWRNMSVEMPTAYKQMRMKEYPHHVHKIFDRHLIIGKELTSEDLVRNEQLQMIHGIFKVSRDNLGALVIEWEGEKARIVKPDIQATNGVIHVIDRVMMKQRDLKKSSAAIYMASNLLIEICLLIKYLLF